jgi:hypothetical protein
MRQLSITRTIRSVLTLAILLTVLTACQKKIPTVLESDRQIYTLKSEPAMPMKICFKLNEVELCTMETPNNVEMMVLHKGWYSRIMGLLDKYLQNELKAEAPK